jgi:hypothetical protein
MYRWVGNDAAKDLYEGYPHEDGWLGKVAMVRPHGDGFRVIVVGTDKQVPVFLGYETQEKAMEAAVGFAKLLKEN